MALILSVESGNQMSLYSNTLSLWLHVLKFDVTAKIVFWWYLESLEFCIEGRISDVYNYHQLKVKVLATLWEVANCVVILNMLIKVMFNVSSCLKRWFNISRHVLN